MENKLFKTRDGVDHDVTEEMLVMVERFGAIHFSPEQVAYFFESDIAWMMETLLSDPNHCLFIAYKKGCLKSELEIREAVFELAKRNSAPAQELAKKYIDELKIQLA